MLTTITSFKRGCGIRNILDGSNSLRKYPGRKKVNIFARGELWGVTDEQGMCSVGGGKGAVAKDKPLNVGHST